MLPILPPAPSRTDPSNFSSKADAWVDALTDWTDAANALEQSLQLVATTGTSTSSLPIGTGSKGLTTQTGKAWGIGSWVYIASASSITNLMQGQVTAYNSGTGNLVVNVTQSTGSGTYTDWVIALASPTTNSANLSGGSAGSIPYQTAVNTTAMLGPGGSGQILKSNGASNPGWIPATDVSPGVTATLRVSAAATISGTAYTSYSTADTSNTLTANTGSGLIYPDRSGYYLIVGQVTAVSGALTAEYCNIKLQKWTGSAADTGDNSYVAGTSSLVDTFSMIVYITASDVSSGYGFRLARGAGAGATGGYRIDYYSMTRISA